MIPPLALIIRTYVRKVNSKLYPNEATSANPLERSGFLPYNPYMAKNKKKHSKIFKVFIALLIALGVFELAAFGALAYYLSDYEHADADAEAAMKSGHGVQVHKAEDWIEFAPSARSQTGTCSREGADQDKADTGIIFYPGGKVEYTAYAPLMRDFAEEGYFCAVVKMPFNLALFDKNAAKDVKEAHPEITNWIIGGHSLGGVVAANYAAISDFDGLFLLAAYPSTDLSDNDIKTASAYGDADGVLNMDEYEASKSNLPPDLTEYVIKGGNHSQFGSYGLQDGDGKATISAEDQREQTVSFVLDTLLTK